MHLQEMPKFENNCKKSIMTSICHRTICTDNSFQLIKVTNEYIIIIYYILAATSADLLPFVSCTMLIFFIFIFITSYVKMCLKRH